MSRDAVLWLLLWLVLLVTLAFVNLKQRALVVEECEEHGEFEFFGRVFKCEEASDDR